MNCANKGCKERAELGLDMRFKNHCPDCGFKKEFKEFCQRT